MHYLDASCCVATLTPESGTARASLWLDAHRAEPLAISLWVHVEVASALAMKVRIGSLNEAGARRSPDRLAVHEAVFPDPRHPSRQLCGSGSNG